MTDISINNSRVNGRVPGRVNQLKEDFRHSEQIKFPDKTYCNITKDSVLAGQRKFSV